MRPTKPLTLTNSEFHLRIPVSSVRDAVNLREV